MQRKTTRNSTAVPEMIDAPKKSGKPKTLISCDSTTIGETDQAKSTIVRLLASKEFEGLQSEAREWFWETDNQTPYSKKKLLQPNSSKEADIQPQLESFKSYHFLMEKLSLSNKEVKELSKVTFQQYLKTKNMPHDPDTVQIDGENFDDLLEEAEVDRLLILDLLA